MQPLWRAECAETDRSVTTWSRTLRVGSSRRQESGLQEPRFGPPSRFLQPQGSELKNALTAINSRTVGYMETTTPLDNYWNIAISLNDRKRGAEKAHTCSL